MPHADNQVFLPPSDYSEDAAVLAELVKRVRALPGRVAVLMDAVPERFSGSDLLVPLGRHAGKFRPDSGTVVASGTVAVGPGLRVVVKPYDGLWLTDKDADWVPKGREVRFYGVASPWWESIVAKL